MRRTAGGSGADDTGTTLIELVVAITLMSIFGGLFTGAVVMMNRSTTKSQSLSLSASQISVAFINLDETVRYATAISRPGQSINTSYDPSGTQTNDWYVEFRTTIADGSARCTQLRIHARQLQQRTWAAATPNPTLTFRPLVSFIINGAAAAGATTQPFYLVDSSATNVGFQQLTINLTAESGTGTTTVTDSSSSVTFSALNSTQSALDTTCAQGMRT